MLVSKVFSRAAQATLNFIENQQRAGGLGQIARGLQKFRAEGANAAFPLNGLQANGANTAIKLALEICHIVKGDEAHAGHHGSEGLAVLLLSGGRERAERPPVKRIFQSQ